MTESEKRGSIEALKHILADTYVLLFNVQHVHWNTVGAGFLSIHQFLDEQYAELAKVIDVLAERIRELDEKAPASLTAMLALSRLKEIPEDCYDVNQGIEFLVKQHQEVSTLLTEHLAILTDGEDHATIDLLTQRISIHDKFSWLLKANLA